MNNNVLNKGDTHYETPDTNDDESKSLTCDKVGQEMTTMSGDDESDDDFKEDEKDEHVDVGRGVPIDRGWAWMVVLGCFMSYFIYGSFFFILSVLFLDIIEIFDTTPTTVTLISSIANLVFCISTQLMVNLIMPIVSVRKMTILCAVIWSFSTLVIVAAPNLPVFFTVCIIKYIAQGGGLVPSLTLVGLYFRRRQALATSFSLLGLSVASIVVPPMTRYLRDEYGFRGFFLILSGVEMNAIVASSLLRPLTSYKKQNSSKVPSNGFNGQQGCQEDATKFGGSRQKRHCDNAKRPKINSECKEAVESFHIGISGQKSNFDLHVSPVSKEIEPLNEDGLKDEYSGPRSESLRNINDNSYSMGDDSNTKQDNSHENQYQIVKTHARELARSNSELKPENVHTNANRPILPPAGHSDFVNRQKPNLTTDPLERISRWSLASGSVAGSMVSIPGYIRRSSSSRYKVNAETDEVCGDQTQSKMSRRFKTILKSVIDLDLLKNLMSWVYLLSFTFNHACVFVSAYLPSYAVKVGVPESSAAVLLTIIGVVDVFSRIGYGYFADLRLVRPGRIIMFATLYMGIVCQFTAFYDSFPSLIFMAVSFGLFGISSFSLNSPLIVDMLGIENLGKMLALGTVLTSIMSSLQFPLHGLMIEKTGTFVVSFHYIGVSYILGSLCLLIEPFVRKLQRKRELKATSEKLASR